MDNINKGGMQVLNDELITRSDEVWVFANDMGFSDGVLEEIEGAEMQGKPIGYFAVKDDKETFIFVGKTVFSK